MTKTRPALHKFLALSGGERRAFLEAVTLVTVTATALRLFSFQRVYRWMERRAPSWTEPPSGAENAVQLLVDGVRRAARPLPYATCLPQSLSLWWLLRRRGVESQLRLGVRKEGGELKAHAWVEFGGVALNDRDDVRHRYAAFETMQLSE